MAIVVSESAAEESLQAFAHPLSIQAKAISELENKVLNGDVVSDGNNVFTFLTEFASNMTATIVNKACDCFSSLYPENAQTCTDLYKHLSDFDYIGLLSTPAETTVEIVFDRNFLIDQSHVVTGNTYRITLPEYSKFTIGEYTFGLMYPINIDIRKAPLKPDGTMDYENCAMTVYWDTTNKNPLKTLESHILEHRDFIKEGQHLTAIQVPIYQFVVVNHLEDAIAASGFAKRYDYNDKFYAIRVFHWKNRQWNEMAQTLSDINYDADIPTAMIKVLQDIGKVEVVIPQYYFNSTKASSRIGNRILIKIYTCKGEMNLDISEYGIDQFAASFLLTDTILVENDEYSSMLKRVPTLYVLPQSTRIASGTDGITMEKLRNRVKHSASYTVKITPDDLNAYFESSGFTFTRELDNITDRVFAAHKVITDKTGTTVASGNGDTVFTPEMLNIEEDKETGELYIPGYSDISVLDAKTVTIKPSAIYKYNPEEDKFYMLSDVEKTSLSNLSTANKVALFNNNLYTYSPFHVSLSIDPDMSIAGSYDLLKPSLKSIVFDWENPNVTAQMSVYSADIKVLEESVNTGYRLSVALYKTQNIADINAVIDDGLTDMNVQVMLSTTNSKGTYVYMLGKYNGKDTSGHDIFIFDITSKFKVYDNSMIDATSMTDDLGNTTGNFIDIGTHQYSLSFFISEKELNKLDSVLVAGRDYAMQDVDITGVPGILDGFIYLCRQNLKLTFGSSLPLLQNNVSLEPTEEVYQTYPTTEFETYRSPIYDRWTAYDFNHQVIDPITGKPVASDKIGSLKLAANYSLTNDTTFVDGKIYYVRSGSAPDYTYTVAVVTPGAPVPANTYYERKLSPAIKHNAGDVITSSQYAYTYGVVASVKYMTVDAMGMDKEVIFSLCLEDPITITSSVNNVWTSINDDLYIYGMNNSRFTGVYTATDRTATGTSRVWKNAGVSNIEMFDTTTLHTAQPVYVYKYVDPETGNDAYSAQVPPVGIPFEIVNGAGTYFSTNSDRVKSDGYVSSAMNTVVKTSAKGFERKWFLTDDEFPFKFNTYTGFVMEYGIVGVDDNGAVYSWYLAFYYQATNPETGTRERKVVIISQDLEASGMIPSEEVTYLRQDSYVSSYQEIYHFLKYGTEGGRNGWMLYETVDPNGVDALIPYYYAYQIPGVDVEEPYEAEWSALTEGDTSSPLFQVLSKDAPVAKIDVKEALSVITDYIEENRTTSVKSSALYKYIDQGKLTTDTVAQEDKTYYSREISTSKSYPYTYHVMDIPVGASIPPDTYELVDAYMVDPLEGKVFVCVPNTDDSREQEFCNSQIEYTPGISDPVYPDRALEVGVTSTYGYSITQDTVFEYGKTYYKKAEDGTYYYTIVTVGERIPPSTYYERVYTAGKGAIYYRDIESSQIDFKTYNLTEEMVMKIITSWNLHSSESEARRYKSVHAETDVAIEILRKIVSDTEPCYISPWKKLVNVSSYEAFKYYRDNRTIVNCKIVDLIDIQNVLKSGYTTYERSYDAASATVEDVTYVFIKDITDMNGYLAWASESLLGSSLQPTCAFARLSPDSGMTCVIAGEDEEVLKKTVLRYSTYSGYMYVLSTGTTPEDLVDTYYHYTSLLPREYYDEDTDTTTTRNEFNINFETSSWAEIDKWPWEISSIWVDIHTGELKDISINFNRVLSCAKVKHFNTDTLIDNDGNPVVAIDGKRTTKHTVNMLHCDYKLTLSNDADYINYTNDVRQLLRSYFDELLTVSPSLLARTKLYYTPIRTFGISTFKGNGGNDFELPLEFSVNLGLHVESYVNGNELNKDTIKANILNLIDARLKEGYLNLALLAKDIMSNLSDNIICVDVLGINGNNTLQTMIPANSDCYPQLQQYLVLADDGSVHTDRRLDITWYVIN